MSLKQADLFISIGRDFEDQMHVIVINFMSVLCRTLGGSFVRHTSNTFLLIPFGPVLTAWLHPSAHGL